MNSCDFHSAVERGPSCSPALGGKCPCQRAAALRSLALVIGRDTALRGDKDVTISASPTDFQLDPPPCRVGWGWLYTVSTK